MIKEIYTRLPSDVNYKLQLETSNEIESILGQIRMILGTKPTEVLGSPYFGVNLSQYLFNFGVDVEEIKMQIIQHFTEYMDYDKQKYHISVDVKYGKSHDASGDYALVDIIINQRKCMGIIVSQT